MKNVTFMFFTWLFAFGILTCNAQKPNPTSEIDSLKNRIEKLETQLNSHDSQISSAESKSNLAYGKAVEAEEIAFKTERKLWWLGFEWLSAGFAAIIGILAFFGVRKYLEQKARSYIEKFIKEPKWVEALNAKVQKHMVDNKLKEEVTIMVISKDEESENKIKLYFRENGFHNSKTKFIRNPEIDIETNSFDVLFINNIANTFSFPKDKFSIDKTELEDLIENKIKGNHKDRKLAVFYFNDDQTQFPIRYDKELNSSFANSLASLYHNLIDLMRYKYLVLDGKNL